MKRLWSLAACCLIGISMIGYRVTYPGVHSGKPLKIAEWDALGYYMYLPAVFIYHDYKKLDWMPAIDHTYGLTGNGNMYQATKTGRGNYVFKYLGGVAILQLPFFAIGHVTAGWCGYPQDGFSAPYQYALGFGALLYAFLALLVLRRLLLHFFTDGVTAITLLLLALATNFIQYAAVENGQSHVYLFLLYPLVLMATLRWHERPRGWLALAIGYIIGLATICRPTEAIMLFIPLLWGLQNKEASRLKWALVKAHRPHIPLAVLGGLLGILPQLIYWKLASGSFIYDVGSKWVFLNPHFRVLFGWEKGWFVYTPIALFFIIGLFFIRRFSFRYSVLIFCLLNIWIIIAWDDWRYGGSYSTRALMQSYPVLALPLAAFIERLRATKWRYIFYAAGVYLTGVNLFQLTQYNATILHYNDMNRLYYSRIYLNPHPTPLDMSLLDVDEFLSNPARFQKHVLWQMNTPMEIKFENGKEGEVAHVTLPEQSGESDRWLLIEATIDAPDNLWNSELHADLTTISSVKHTHIRLANPVAEKSLRYAFYVEVPGVSGNPVLSLFITRPGNFTGLIKDATVTLLLGG